MQYVWKHGLWIPGDLRTAGDGAPVAVIDRGLHNTDAGPDFFNAKVRIGSSVWAGNVEIHVRASDWFRHGHHKDPAYDSVILHVVAEDDARITRPDGTPIPQIVMDCAPDFDRRYRELVFNGSDLACHKEVRDIPGIYVSDWITSLAMTRLQRKADAIRLLVQGGPEATSWRSAVYLTLARALGFGTNSDPFERLARLVPLKSLLKHSDSLDMVEGLLFGQAGLIPAPGQTGTPDSVDELYIATITREYEFMKRKFNIAPSPSPLGWKMARMRPPNFPHRRIAALASLVVPGFEFGHRILDIRTRNEAAELLSVPLRGYWSHHYCFGVPAKGSPMAFGQTAIDTIIINVVAPALYAHGEIYGREDLTAAAVALLDSMKPEDNNITRLFAREAGIRCRSALESQAMIELRRMYCEQRKCLYCRLGHYMLARKVKP